MSETHHPLYQRLIGISDKQYVCDKDFALYAYSKDASPIPGVIPGIIVRPGSTNEVAEIVKVANEASTPIVPRGGGSTMFGISPGIAGESIIIDTTRMNKVLEINENNNTVTAECGITCSELETKVHRQTPNHCVSTASCPAYVDTLGGLLSSGIPFGGFGQRAYVHGMNKSFVSNMEVVLPNGEVIQTGSGCYKFAKANMEYAFGPDLNGLFLHDAGMLGIKTKATLRLIEEPNVWEIDTSIFETSQDTLEAVYQLSHLAPFLYSSIMAVYIPSIKKGIIGFSAGGKTEKEVYSKLQRIRKVCESTGGSPGTDESKIIADMWCSRWPRIRNFGREKTPISGPFEMWGAMGWFVPRERVRDEYRRFSILLEKEKQVLDRYNIHHGIDLLIPVRDNCFIIEFDFSYDDSNVQTREKALELIEKYNKLAFESGLVHFQPMGGRWAIKQQIPMLSSTYLGFLRLLKRSIDPNNIMNPGLL